MLGLVRQQHRIAPIGPLHLVKQAGLDPFGHFRQKTQRLLHQCGQAPLGHSVRQCVNRLAQSAQHISARIAHVIGMNDLQHLAILIEPPGDPLLFAQRQLFLRPAAIAPEIGQRADVAGAITGENSQRTSPRRTAIFDGRQRDHHVFTHARFIEIRHRPALNETFWQVINEVFHPRKRKAVQRARKVWPDTLEALRFDEQRVEVIRAHGALLITCRANATSAGNKAAVHAFDVWDKHPAQTTKLEIYYHGSRRVY